MCIYVCVRQSQSEFLCIWASGGGTAIICSKLLAGRGEVGETVIQKESKGGRGRGGGAGKEEMSWQGRKNTERKEKQGEREGE